MTTRIRIDPQSGRRIQVGELVTARQVGRGDSNEVIGVYLGDDNVAMIGPSYIRTSNSSSELNWNWRENWANGVQPDLPPSMDTCKAFIRKELSDFIKKANETLSGIIKADEVSDFNDGASAVLEKFEELREEFQKEITQRESDLLKSMGSNEYTRAQMDHIHRGMDLRYLSEHWDQILAEKLAVVGRDIAVLYLNMTTNGISSYGAETYGQFMTQSHHIVSNYCGDLVTLRDIRIESDSREYADFGRGFTVRGRSTIGILVVDFKQREHVYRVPI